MGAGAMIGSCMRGLPCHPEDGLGPKSITVTPEMAKHNRGVTDQIQRLVIPLGPTTQPDVRTHLLNSLLI